MQSRTIGFVVCLLVVLSLALMVVLCGPEVAGSADPSPSPSPSASPTPTATPTPPASAATVHRALRVRRSAVKAWRTWNRARACFELARRPFASPKPARSASEAVWTAALRSWRAKRADLRARFHRLRHQMRHPGGSSNGVRWMPLARWVGWPRGTLGTLAYIIMRESSGRQNAVNPSSGCAGLLQLHPCHGVAHPCDPEVNLRYGLKLWRGSGWSPWAVS